MAIILIVFLLLAPLPSFSGDYDFPKYAPKISLSENMRHGIASVNSSVWACTCFSTKTEQGSQLLGRDFDWSDPPGRYASVSMVDISYLGYAKSDAPVGRSFMIHPLWTSWLSWEKSMIRFTSST
jgi:hypothetical protein